MIQKWRAISIYHERFRNETFNHDRMNN